MLISVRLRLINVEAPRCECEVSLHQCGRRETSVFPQTTSPSPKGAALILFGFFFSFSFLAHCARPVSVSHLFWRDATAAARRGTLSCPSSLSFFFFFPFLLCRLRSEELKAQRYAAPIKKRVHSGSIRRPSEKRDFTSVAFWPEMQ